MSLSLNEVESLSRKAARGAGLSWGMAEEAGRAVRWLEAGGIGGADALASVLLRHDDKSLRAPGLSEIRGQGGAGDLPLCPIATGAALSDFGLGENTLTLDAVFAPILLAGPLARVAGRMGAELEALCKGGALCLSPEGMAICGDVSPWLEGAAIVEIRRLTGDVPGAPNARRTRAHPAPAVLDILNGFAARTYAPATEASRLAGAGAGPSDND